LLPNRGEIVLLKIGFTKLFTCGSGRETCVELCLLEFFLM
jgi:hypothetical protein